MERPEISPDCGLIIQYGSCLNTSSYSGLEAAADGWHSVYRCSHCGMERLAWSPTPEGSPTLFVGYRKMPGQIRADRDAFAAAWNQESSAKV